MDDVSGHQVRVFEVRRIYEPVSCEFEPSLFDQNLDIEHSRTETGTRHWPDVAQNGEKIASETRHHLANSRECRANSRKQDMPCRDRTGWLVWEDSNLTAWHPARAGRHAGHRPQRIALPLDEYDFPEGAEDRRQRRLALQKGDDFDIMVAGFQF